MDKKMLSPKEVCFYVEDMGVNKTRNTFLQTLILGILAGCFIALGAFASQVGSHSVANFGLSKVIAGTIFPVGLIFVLVCGAELFTGNCLLSVAYARKKITGYEFIRNLIIVFIGNYIGAAAVALLVSLSGSIGLNDGALAAYMMKVAYKKCNLTFIQALTSGIICNLLVCLSVWGSYASKDVIGKIFMGFFPIFAFVITGAEHCVANMYYLNVALLAKGSGLYNTVSHLSAEQLAKIDAGHIIRNLSAVTLGNFIGGAIFVGLAYFVVYMQIPGKKENIEKQS